MKSNLTPAHPILFVDDEENYLLSLELTMSSNGITNIETCSDSRRVMSLMAEQEVYAYRFEGKRYDAGTTMGWLKASVELALERPDIGAEFRSYLAGVDLR